jgi:hypothetical protein
MMLELQRQYPVRTPIGYGWATICSKESGLANDLWTVVMEKDGAHCHFRSDQIFALQNGTLDIATTKENSGTIPFKSEPHNHTTSCNTTTTTEVPPSRGNQTTPKRPSGAAQLRSKAATLRSASGSKRAKAGRISSR